MDTPTEPATEHTPSQPAGFQRARSDEQREARRRAILGVAADMVGEMPVADLSLNELSRRVGLAKSNVLRYFESREAVLLELLDSAWRDWLGRLAAALPDGVDAAAPARTRYEQIATVIAGSLVDDRLYCELMSVSAAVLERNVSPEVARRYKLAAIANTNALAELVGARLTELSPQGALYFAAGTLVATAGLWPQAQPSKAMLSVYEEPAMAVLRLDFGTAMYEMLATVLTGCVARWPATPPE
ncbi:TetR/AcrR family transcriptional regulator [Rugosimonospora africana]|uniref:TetR family transcriptional regulator n=1 Tax=Rugosimonospora africana TaxID=556532 RepID=A0A8J3QU64_9ACTN|nr:TetR/AcrR family transcriptional regulator [Rugosimonospora africana]GIH15758.1 TetR family transcriptional regulator [Rugosimonospora africana]